MCEAGVGYDDEEVYPGVLLPGGTLVVSTGFGGIASSPDGCGWSPWLPSEQPFVADVRTDPSSPGTVLALEARSDGEVFVNRLWRSSDGAKTWQPFGAAFAPEVLASSFAISEVGELYVGALGPAGAELLRSADVAVSWERASLTADPGVTPRVIGARGQPGSARIFVVADYAQAEGLSVAGDRALFSNDGGRTFATLLEASGDLSSWSLSADGARLVVGGHDDGVYLLDDASNAVDGAVLTRISSRRVHALAWGGQGQLYAAGHEASDGFSLGVSADEGRTFQPVFALCQVRGPLDCSADSSVGAQCLSGGETGWDVRKEVADSDACNTPGELTGDAGASAGERGDAPGADDTSESKDSPIAQSAQASESEAGCGVSAGRARGHWGIALGIALFAVSRRRRKRRPTHFGTSGILPQSTSDSVESMRKCEPVECRSA